ncbi:hypothetical protein ACTGWM_01535 [Streptococcus suis]
MVEKNVSEEKCEENIESYSTPKITERIKLARCVCPDSNLFGNAIYTSTMQWIASLSATEVVENGVQSFTAADSWWALVNQGKLFLFALVYLLIRNYDFKQLKVKLE